MFAFGRVLNRQSFLFLLEKNSNRKAKLLVSVGRKATDLLRGGIQRLPSYGITTNSRVAEEVIRLCLFRNGRLRGEAEVFRDARSSA